MPFSLNLWVVFTWLKASILKNNTKQNKETQGIIDFLSGLLKKEYKRCGHFLKPEMKAPFQDMGSNSN